jgi:hypothetical protein
MPRSALGPGDRLAVDGDRSCGRLEEARHRVEQCRLTATRRTDDRNELARTNVDRNVAHGFDATFDRVVGEPEMLDLDEAG